MALLEIKHLSKSYAQKVLSDVNFTLEAGEVHALLGENGAGKSTMLNIIGGIVKADGGEILIDGKKVNINSVQDAKNFGIGFVHQEIELCQEATVAENIMMSNITDSNALIINFKKLIDFMRLPKKDVSISTMVSATDNSYCISLLENGEVCMTMDKKHHTSIICYIMANS